MNKQVVDRLTEQIGKETRASVKEFLFELKLGNRSKKTIRYYKDNLEHFLKIAPQYVDQINSQHIKQSLYDKQDTVYAMHGLYRALRSFMNWCISQEYYSHNNPVSLIKPPKLPNRIIPTISPDEFKRLIASCDNKFLGRRDKAIIMILYDTGLRLQELGNMQLGDIDLGNGLIKVVGKGNKERLVRMGTSTIKALWDYIKQRDSKLQAVWLSEERRPLTPDGIGQLIKRMGQRTGLPHISPHKFRHSFAVNYLRNGGDTFTLKILLGHSSLAIVQQYTKSLDSADAVLAHEKFSPVDRLGI